MGLKRRGSKGIFWTDFKVARRRIRVSTGFTDLKLARQREAELKKEARFARLGWRKPAPPFSDWTKTYESAFTVQKARGTQRRDREILARAREFFGTTPIDQIARSDCETYVNWRRKSGNANPTYKAGIRPLADGTVTQEVSFLQALFQAALDDGLLEANPWRKVKRERYKSRERVITPEEQVVIEDKLPGGSCASSISSSEPARDWMKPERSSPLTSTGSAAPFTSSASSAKNATSLSLPRSWTSSASRSRPRGGCGIRTRSACEKSSLERPGVPRWQALARTSAGTRNSLSAARRRHLHALSNPRPRQRQRDRTALRPPGQHRHRGAESSYPPGNRSRRDRWNQTSSEGAMNAVIVVRYNEH